MEHSRFTEEQIIGILKEQEVGTKTVDVCRTHGISDATFDKCNAKLWRCPMPASSRRLRTRMPGR